MRLCLALCLVLLGTGGRSLVVLVTAQAPVVYVVPIDRVIDIGRAPFVG
jgi:hypothetical protein